MSLSKYKINILTVVYHGRLMSPPQVSRLGISRYIAYMFISTSLLPHANRIGNVHVVRMRTCYFTCIRVFMSNAPAPHAQPRLDPWQCTSAN